MREVKQWFEYKDQVTIMDMFGGRDVQICELVEHITEDMDEDLLLSFVMCLDAYQESAEFTEHLAYKTTDEYVRWVIDADISKDDPDWYQEIIDKYEAVVAKLKENQ